MQINPCPVNKLFCVETDFTDYCELEQLCQNQPLLLVGISHNL